MTPLNSLINFDFANPVQIVLTLVLLAVAGYAAYVLYKEIRRIYRRQRRNWKKVAYTSTALASSGTALTDAFGLPSWLIDQVGLAGLLLV